MDERRDTNAAESRRTEENNTFACSCFMHSGASGILISIISANFMRICHVDLHSSRFTPDPKIGSHSHSHSLLQEHTHRIRSAVMP